MFKKDLVEWKGHGALMSFVLCVDVGKVVAAQ